MSGLSIHKHTHHNKTTTIRPIEEEHDYGDDGSAGALASEKTEKAFLRSNGPNV